MIIKYNQLEAMMGDVAGKRKKKVHAQTKISSLWCVLFLAKHILLKGWSFYFLSWSSKFSSFFQFGHCIFIFIILLANYIFSLNFF
jgi:hypothetical protein